MNRNYRLMLLLFFLPCYSALYAQDSTCNCQENLSVTIQKTEENYAGYPAKVNAASRKAYNTLVQQLKQKAKTETSSKKCYYIIAAYIRFFKDKHFILSYDPQADIDSAVIPYDKSYLQKQWQAKKLSPVEGIWISPDSATTIAIQKASDGSFKAIKIKSTKDQYPTGFVYFTLTPYKDNYLFKEYNSFISTATPARQYGNLLQLWNQAMWGKIYPQQMSAPEAATLATWKNNNNGLAFKKLNADFAYLKIPTFRNNDAAIQQLVAQNDAVIRSTPYLVVDLTGNGGGNTGWIFFLPYFMTNPITQASSFVRVTPDNVKLKLADLAPYANNPIPDDYKKYFPDTVLKLYQQAYNELPVTKEPFYPIPGVTFPLDSITQYPKKIALLVDDLCGSSTEYFFFLSRQSQKTIRYGTNTIGMMDYEGMSIPTPLPDKQLILTIPIVKSSWTDAHPIDQTGFTPDVLLTTPKSKWLEFIMKDLPGR